MLKSIYLTYFSQIPEVFVGSFYAYFLLLQSKARQLGAGHLEMLYVLGFGGCRAGVLSVFSNLYSFFRAQEIPLEMTHQENRVPNEQNKWLATNSWQSSGTEETSILGRLTYLVVHRLRAGASGMPKPCSCKLRISEVLDLSFTSSLRWREPCFQA